MLLWSQQFTKAVHYKCNSYAVLLNHQKDSKESGRPKRKDMEFLVEHRKAFPDAPLKCGVYALQLRLSATLEMVARGRPKGDGCPQTFSRSLYRTWEEKYAIKTAHRYIHKHQSIEIRHENDQLSVVCCNLPCYYNNN